MVLDYTRFPIGCGRRLSTTPVYKRVECPILHGIFDFPRFSIIRGKSSYSAKKGSTVNFREYFSQICTNRKCWCFAGSRTRNVADNERGEHSWCGGGSGQLTGRPPDGSVMAGSRAPPKTYRPQRVPYQRNRSHVEKILRTSKRWSLGPLQNPANLLGHFPKRSRRGREKQEHNRLIHSF